MNKDLLKDLGLKSVAAILVAIVSIWGSADFIIDKFDKKIEEKVEERVQIAFREKEAEYIHKVELKVGRMIDPIDEMVKQITSKDSIKIVYERIIPYIKERSEYSSMGLHINKKTKQKIYTDQNGIDYEVYTVEEGDTKGRLYYFNGKQIVYI